MGTSQLMSLTGNRSGVRTPPSRLTSQTELISRPMPCEGVTAFVPEKRVVTPHFAKGILKNKKVRTDTSHNTQDSHNTQVMQERLKL